MPKLLESGIERPFKEWCEKTMGCTVFKLGEGGDSDRLVACPNGYCLFIELKREGKKPRDLQLYKLEQLQKKRHFAGWADNLTSAKNMVGTVCSFKPTNYKNFLL